MSDPRFEIRRNRLGQFHFVFKSENGREICSSEYRGSKRDVRRAIDCVKRLASEAVVADRSGK